MDKIKVGIDAKWYFNGPISNKIVIQNIVNELLRQKNDEVEYYFFLDKNFKERFSELAAINPDIKIVPVWSRINMLANIIIIPYLANKLKLDFVIFQNFCSFIGNFKKILYIHDVLFLDFPQYFSKKELLYYNFMPLLAKAADHIITISRSEKDRLINHRISKGEEISVIYHGIDAHFKPLEQYDPMLIDALNKKYDLPPKYILFVGRINERKNITNLLKALPLVKDKEIVLVIVGATDHKVTNVDKHIANLRLQSRVLFLKELPQEDMYKVYARSTLFCFLSFAEGFGLPPLEAMKCGIPVIVSNRTALPEVCGEAALYINPNNPDDIADKINDLLNNNKKYELMHNLSLVHSSNFSWVNTASSITDLLFCRYMSNT